MKPWEIEPGTKSPAVLWWFHFDPYRNGVFGLHQDEVSIIKRPSWAAGLLLSARLPAGREIGGGGAG